MSKKIDELIEVGNALIYTLRGETNLGKEDVLWELVRDDFERISKEELVRLTQLSNMFSNLCLDLEDEIYY